MDIWFVVASLAVVFTSVQMVPQVYKSLKTRKVRDISIYFTVIVVLGASSWLAYGIHIRSLALIVANFLNLMGALILLSLKIKEKF